MVASGKLRISANASFQTSHSVNPIISASINGNPLKILLWSFQNQLGNFSVTANVSITAVFEYDSSATAGQTVEIFFTSTTGDGVFSSFVQGSGDACSSLLLEELP